MEVSFQTRRDILQNVAPQYQQASSAERNTLVDEFIAITGYNRRYARWLLNHAEAVQSSKRRSNATDQRSSKPCSWRGMPPTGFAPSA